MLKRIKGRIVHKRLDRISPLAVPVMLEIGREAVAGGEADEHVLREAADDLVRDAMGEDDGNRQSAIGNGGGSRQPTADCDAPAAVADAPALVGVMGVVLEAFREGALWWADERLLVVADLHLEKGSSFARRGQMLPPYDTGETLARLSALVARLAAEGRRRPRRQLSRR